MKRRNLYAILKRRTERLRQVNSAAYAQVFVLPPFSPIPTDACLDEHDPWWQSEQAQRLLEDVEEGIATAPKSLNSKT